MLNFIARNYWVWAWLIITTKLLFFPNQGDYYEYIGNISHYRHFGLAGAFYHNSPAYTLNRLIIPIISGTLLSTYRLLKFKQQAQNGKPTHHSDVQLTWLLLMMAMFSLPLGLATQP